MPFFYLAVCFRDIYSSLIILSLFPLSKVIEISYRIQELLRWTDTPVAAQRDHTWLAFRGNQPKKCMAVLMNSLEENASSCVSLNLQIK